MTDPSVEATIGPPIDPPVDPPVDPADELSVEPAEEFGDAGDVSDDPADEVLLGSSARTLSPSRAGDFLSCPLLYRLRTIDRLPEDHSPEAVRGTLVHKVLELLFDLPTQQRSPERAALLLPEVWASLRSEEPSLMEIFADEGTDQESWLASCHATLARYFELEDPRRLEPAERELYLEATLDSGLVLRGYLDRLDATADGRLRIVDYKTGRSPGLLYEARALFQLRFYALMVMRLRGVVPQMLQLIYLGNGEILRFAPDADDLAATERKIEAIAEAIERNERTGEWLPNPSIRCRWCSFHEFCPEYGGSPPPLPEQGAVLHPTAAAELNAP